MANKETVNSKITAYIRENIQNGTWMLGDKLPSENTMCKELQVSRTAVRNALHQFITLGILQSEHGKGTFLISNDSTVFGHTVLPQSQDTRNVKKEDLRNLLDLRCLVEPQICYKVASYASDGLILYLESLLNTMKASVGNTEVFTKADMEFHLAIARAYENPMVTDLMENLSQHKINNHALNNAIGYYGGIYYHTLLLDALKKHDSRKAQSIMEEHLLRGISDLEIDTSITDPSSSQIPSEYNQEDITENEFIEKGDIES